MFLKGERCYTPKCAVERRRRTPGETSPRRRRASEWGVQLREKQKVRQSYGMLERQFSNYFRTARRMPGVTGANLLQLLERRLDNVVYRLGFAVARQQARQWVLHGHYTVNGRKVSIPSFRVKQGDVVAWKESSKEKGVFTEASRQVGQRPLPAWLELDRAAMVATVARIPEASEVDAPADTRLVTEYYSR